MRPDLLIIHRLTSTNNDTATSTPHNNSATSMKSVKKCCNLGYLGLILDQDPENLFEQVGYFETDAEKAKEKKKFYHVGYTKTSVPSL